jgi:hypothetical protein
MAKLTNKTVKYLLIEVIKRELAKAVSRELLKGATSGLGYTVIYLIVSQLTDKLLAPVIAAAIKEGSIRYSVSKCKEKLKAYVDSSNRIDRIDSFNELL